MRRFVLAWEKRGLGQRLGSRIVNYADDLVILCKRGKADEAQLKMREIMGQLKLTVNEEKTRICKVPAERFDFLGFTFGRMYSMCTGQARLGYRPSKRSIQHMVRKIHALTAEAMVWQETTACGGQVELHVAGLGELLSSRKRQPCIPCTRQLHHDAVASVVTQWHKYYIA